jgi:hypothetical protein
MDRSDLSREDRRRYRRHLRRLARLHGVLPFTTYVSCLWIDRFPVAGGGFSASYLPIVFETLINNERYIGYIQRAARPPNNLHQGYARVHE